MKITHDIKCDECGEPATRNVQQSWVHWGLQPNGDYTLDPIEIEECGGDNYHYCDNCN